MRVQYESNWLHGAHLATLSHKPELVGANLITRARLSVRDAADYHHSGQVVSLPLVHVNSPLPLACRPTNSTIPEFCTPSMYIKEQYDYGYYKQVRLEQITHLQLSTSLGAAHSLFGLCRLDQMDVNIEISFV